jgi:hypothetical protein
MLKVVLFLITFQNLMFDNIIVPFLSPLVREYERWQMVIGLLTQNIQLIKKLFVQQLTQNILFYFENIHKLFNWLYKK